jgi:hypothetical protein
MIKTLFVHLLVISVFLEIFMFYNIQTKMAARQNKTTFAPECGH